MLSKWAWEDLNYRPHPYQAWVERWWVLSRVVLQLDQTERHRSRPQRKNSTGTTTMLSTSDVSNPPSTTIASGCWISLPDSPAASARGRSA